MIASSGLVWDACCLLNLLATGRAKEILIALGSPSWVVREVHEAEVIKLRPLPEEEGGEWKTVDMDSFIRDGVLGEIVLDELEIGYFVHFASEIDDGEARSAAVAFKRQLTVVTDDLAAIRLLKAHNPPIAYITTPDWVNAWAEHEAVAKPELSQVLRRIHLCACYLPRRVHPLYEWWMDNVRTNE